MNPNSIVEELKLRIARADKLGGQDLSVQVEELRVLVQAYEGLRGYSEALDKALTDMEEDRDEWSYAANAHLRACKQSREFCVAAERRAESAEKGLAAAVKMAKELERENFRLAAHVEELEISVEGIYSSTS